jgi:subtilisin family serine protease
LYAHQWHLKNTGQSSYSNVPAIANEDINVEPVWSENITGKGIRVAVIDEGVEINHPDLIDNIDLDLSWNYLTSSRDTTPTNPNNAHGTAVAGIIASKGWNGIGGRGVAPDATIVSYNMLESQMITTEYFNLALESLVRNISQIDIYNNSWGMESGTLYENHDLDSYYYQFANQLRYGALHGRGDKGSIYIKSAGNDRYQNEDGLYKKYWDANYNPEQVERYMIVVGASGADGTYAWYSNPGENILVSAPGGGTQSYYLEANQQMIITTDLSGKSQGSDYEASSGLDIAHFNVEGNENYDYTNRMNGTSAAGPIVSGVVALMLEANPDLTWRDVRYILAKTAQNSITNYRDTLPTVPTITNMIFWNPTRVYNKNLGFGRVNAALAVEVAKYWNMHNISLAPETSSFVQKSTFVNSISSTNQAVVEVSFDFSSALVSRVEYVNVEFSIVENNSTLPDSNKHEVILISNNGTEAKLIDYDFVDSTNGLDASAVFYKTRMGANRFLDENPKGEWKLVVKANELEENLSFRLDNLKVEIHGR